MGPDEVACVWSRSDLKIIPPLLGKGFIRRNWVVSTSQNIESRGCSIPEDPEKVEVKTKDPRTITFSIPLLISHVAGLRAWPFYRRLDKINQIKRAFTPSSEGRRFH